MAQFLKNKVRERCSSRNDFEHNSQSSTTVLIKKADTTSCWWSEPCVCHVPFPRQYHWFSRSAYSEFHTQW